MSISKEHKIVKYVTIMQVLYEMSDDLDLKDSIFNTKIIQDRCFDLKHSLKKQIWKMYRGKKDGVWKVDDYIRPEDWDKAVLQHAEAAEQMINFFEVGLQLEKMDRIKIE
jgi:hypothetical protein